MEKKYLCFRAENKWRKPYVVPPHKHTFSISLYRLSMETQLPQKESCLQLILR